MEKTLTTSDIKSNIKIYFIDFILVLFIYFVPAISHLVAFPIYYLDPMRIVLLIALIHTTKKNSFIIAVTLPLFSFLISSHPQIIKSLLLSFELLINLALFFYLKEKIKNVFSSLFISIIFSKVFYYLIKFIFIQLGVIDDKLISTPIYFQILITIILSSYFLLVDKMAKRKEKV